MSSFVCFVRWASTRINVCYCVWIQRIGTKPPTRTVVIICPSEQTIFNSLFTHGLAGRNTKKGYFIWAVYDGVSTWKRFPHYLPFYVENPPVSLVHSHPWWRHQMDFPRHWPFVREIHWSDVDSPHKVQWSGALMLFYLRLNKQLSK